MFGTVLGQLVVVVGSPILTRLYTPAELGGLAVFIGLAATLSVVSSFGYQLAIPLPADRQVAANVASLAATVVLVSCILITLAALRFSPLDVAGGVGGILWLLGPCVFAVSGFQILFLWTTREGKFRGAGMARVVQATTQILGQLGAGVVRLGLLGLVGAYVTAQFMGIAGLWKTARIPSTGVSARRMVSAAIRYRKFPQFTMWGSLANAASTQLPAVLVGSLYGLTLAGEFSLALRVLALPAALLGQAIAQVFYPKAAAAAEQPLELRRIIDRATGLLFLTALTFFLPIIALGRELFGTVFGSQWLVAGELGQWVAIWSAVALVTSPVSTLYLVAGRQGTGFLFSVIDATAKGAALIVGGWWGGGHVAIQAFALTSAASYLAFHVWTLSLVDLRLWQWFRPYVRESAMGIAVLAGLFLLRGRVPAVVLWLSGTILVGFVSWPNVQRLILGEARQP